MKVAAVVILYHPPENVVSNIYTYYSYVDKLFIFDNTETESSAVKQALLKLPKVEFFQDFKNEGIAKRLNSGAEKALYEHYDWLLTMDQDTNFSESAISNYLSCFHRYEDKANVAMFGTRYSRTAFASSGKCAPAAIHELITSGMLLNLSLFKKLGNFDEALFIDSVDHDYCLRAKAAGFAIIEFSNIYILHKVGEQVHRSSVKTLYLQKRTKEIHSPLRCYYMYRNMLYLEKKYKDVNPSYIKILRKTVANHIKACFFYGRREWKIIKYLVAAYKDFKNGKMGKI